MDMDTNATFNYRSELESEGDDQYFSPRKDPKKRPRSDSDEKNASTSQQLDRISRTLTRVARNTDEIPKIAQSVKDLEKMSEAHHKRISKLEETVEYMMKGGQQNLILFGVEEAEDEDTKQVAERFIFDKLGGIRTELEYARRLGKETATRTRLIQMRLKPMEIRNELISKRNMLFELNKATGSSYYLNEDIPKSEREEQARIRKAYKDIKSKDSEAKIKGKRILSHGRICTIDEHGKQSWEEMK